MALTRALRVNQLSLCISTRTLSVWNKKIPPCDIYSVALLQQDQLSPTETTNDNMFSKFKKDYIKAHPEIKLQWLKDIKRESEFKVIMCVKPTEILFNILPTRIVLSLFCSVPIFYLCKMVASALHLPLYQAHIVASALSLFCLLKLLSSICIEIRKNSKTSTYSALFPFRMKEVYFRQDHVRMIAERLAIPENLSNSKQFLQMKGRKVMSAYDLVRFKVKGTTLSCPRDSFLNHTHYDDLCVSEKIRRR